MPGVFISYRRDDSLGFAGRLAADLTDILGAEAEVRDIEIPVGSDFTDVLRRAIAASDLLVVVIGRQWAAEGQRERLFEPTDWVRTEIEAAFAQGKHVVPVLVGGAMMPPASRLPPSLARLSRLQAATLTDRHWSNDIEALVERIHALCPGLTRADANVHRTETSPAEVLEDLGERLLEEVASRERRRSRATYIGPSLGGMLLAAFGRGLKRFFGSAFLVLLVYAGLKLFGDAEILAMLDAFEARLALGWERLQGYLSRL